ncbi:GMC family oxidoreductase [Terasakiella pusilla]|uniref:GMC family oxidoreductase n=1 Tax=Terasakiella pusilla TaxID=64973 RepID=UPI000491E9B5|nr:GMC family oxidoreductase N-terminal domain-containing protein [Terasakiella pusilla]
MNTYDYVIVGGGTAGCILANRLTACGKYKVLLLEAGGEPRSMWISIPAGFSKLLTNKKYNWNFKVAPEENTKNREIAVPRGKGLGGSTLINGMIYAWGQREDYDAWQDMGAVGWGFKDVEPYFQKLETFSDGAQGRGKKGPMNIDLVHERFPVSSAFLEAAKERGHPINPDYNNGDQSGFGYYQTAMKGGKRWSVVDGYLKPARKRTNLRVETHALVQDLDIEGKKCVGVTYLQNGQRKSVKANKEVIMAAGAIQTPQLLELSGIGSPDLLKSHGIEVKHDLARVGENYIDHFATRMNWRVKNTVTLNEMARGWRLGLEVAKYYTQKKGILTLGTGLVHGFVKTKPVFKTPDVQYFFVHASYANAAERKLDKAPGMTIGVTQLRPESQGSIHIQSPRPDMMPAIKPNFLSVEEDRRSIVEGMKMARDIVRASKMSHFVDYELCPGKNVQSDDEWLDFARGNGQTIYHPIATCRMGTDDQAVVDTKLKVKGLDGLRIVDASVMPKMVSGNTQAAVMMVAEKASDLILND